MPRGDAHRTARLALTPRQVQIMDLLSRGQRTREIARRLKISERAVTAHITRLMQNFGVENRTALIAAAMAGQARTATLDDRELARYQDAPFLIAATSGPDHVFRYVNRMWQRVMGLSAGDVLGRTVREVFPDAPPASYSARQRAYSQGRPTTGDDWHFTWTTAGGTSRDATFNYIYQPLRDAAGEVTGLLLIVTEQLERPSARTT